MIVQCFHNDPTSPPPPQQKRKKKKKKKKKEEEEKKSYNKGCQSVHLQLSRKGRAGIAASVDANLTHWVTETEKRLLTSGIQYSLYELVLTSCSRFSQDIHVNVVFGSYIDYFARGDGEMGCVCKMGGQKKKGERSVYINW